MIPKEHPELSDLPGDIRVWTGWPIFDMKVVQFEMNQWMEAAGLMRGFGEAIRPEVENWQIENEIERAQEGLSKIMEWNRS